MYIEEPGGSYGVSGKMDETIALREQLWILGVSLIQMDNTLAVIKLFYPIVNIFYIVAFVCKKGTFRNRMLMVNKEARTNNDKTMTGTTIPQNKEKLIEKLIISMYNFPQTAAQQTGN